MLREEKNIRQIAGEPPRRWFSDDYFDLIIWLEKDGSVWGFQLCYDREKKPRALTWTKAYGYKHAGIDTGEHVWGSSQSSPVLVEDGLFDTKNTGVRLEEASGGLPPELGPFVVEKVKTFRL
ncbi:MAG TPA: hypothetical protein DCZ92_03235 [Elusimicrobia bacterium]|nr:MAG: hypothetical protein A2016_04265 [Elusimicrobia bacterium GWF2_62_30]HBA59832.1 hypothetical protein [Elusimicrobiota bacterium]